MPVTAVSNIEAVRKAKRKTVNKTYYDANRDAIVANQRRIYQANKEVIKRKRRERYAKQKAAQLERSAAKQAQAI